MARFLKVAAAGCLVFVAGSVLLAGVTAVVAGAWVKRQVGNIVGDDTSDHARRLGALRRSRPFLPAADGTISEEQAERFFAVCERYRRERLRLGPEHERRLRELQQSRTITFDGIVFWLTVGNDLREAFLGALEQERLSLEEYRYLHACVFKAAMVLLAREAKQQTKTDGLSVETLLPPAATGITEADQIRALAGDLRAVPEPNVEAVWRRRARLAELMPAAPRGGMLFPLLADDAVSPFW